MREYVIRPELQKIIISGSRKKDIRVALKRIDRADFFLIAAGRGGGYIYIRISSKEKNIEIVNAPTREQQPYT